MSICWLLAVLLSDVFIHAENPIVEFIPNVFGNVTELLVPAKDPQLLYFSVPHDNPEVDVLSRWFPLESETDVPAPSSNLYQPTNPDMFTFEYGSPV